MSEEEPKRTLHVSNLPYDFDSEELRDKFLSYGIVTRIDIPNNRGRSKTIAFVVFKEISDATAALIGLNGELFHGKKLEIHYSRHENIVNHQFQQRKRPRGWGPPYRRNNDQDGFDKFMQDDNNYYPMMMMDDFELNSRNHHSRMMMGPSPISAAAAAGIQPGFQYIPTQAAMMPTAMMPTPMMSAPMSSATMMMMPTTMSMPAAMAMSALSPFGTLQTMPMQTMQTMQMMAMPTLNNNNINNNLSLNNNYSNGMSGRYDNKRRRQLDRR